MLLLLVSNTFWLLDLDFVGINSQNSKEGSKIQRYISYAFYLGGLLNMLEYIFKESQFKDVLLTSALIIFIASVLDW